MQIKHYIRLLNPDGGIVSERKGISKSLLKNFYTIFYALLSGNVVTVIDTGGTEREFTPYKKGGSVYCRGYRLTSPESNINYGILIGTSDTPVSPDDYKLSSIFSCHSYVTDVNFPYVTRIFLNNNTDTVIKEIGLAANVCFYVLILRDVISPIDFPLDYTLEVKYEFTF